MDTKTGGLIGFLIGAAVGSAAAWYFTKKHCEDGENQRIADIRRYYQGKLEKIQKTEERKTGYYSILDENGYKTGDDEFRQLVDKEHEKIGYKTNAEANREKGYEPYVISPSEYGELDNYERVTLYYYEEDKTLVDLGLDRIEDADAIVGEDFADHFGEYEDDCVYIRNDGTLCDYEILLRYGSFSESERIMNEE